MIAMSSSYKGILPLTEEEVARLREKPVEIQAFLCKDPWEPAGLCSPFSYNLPIEVVGQEDDSIEITAYMCPTGFDCSVLELSAIMLPEGKDAIDCLLCQGACDSPYEVTNTSEAFNLIMREIINRARTTHPAECYDPCHVLTINDRAAPAANWAARNMIYYDYFSQIDRAGRGPQQRMDVFYVNYSVVRELIWTKTYTDEDKSYSDIAIEVLNDWMNDIQFRNRLMGSEWKSVAFGIAKKQWGTIGHGHDKYVVVADFLDLLPLSDFLFPRPTFLCTGECVQDILWSQEYTEVQTAEGFIRRAEPFINTLVRVPRICNIFKLQFLFELSPAHAEWVFPSWEGEIPEDNSLKFCWEEYLDGYYWKHRWALESTTTFVPGEMMMVWAWIENYTGPCNPFLLAYGYFETQCYTSAKIAGCGLLEYNEGTRDYDVVEGGPGYELDDLWIGDERLQWYVSFKGSNYWIFCSDFAKYEIGDRVGILKNGLSMSVDSMIELCQNPACRFPWSSGGELPDMNSVLSYNNVAYALDRTRDVIIPKSFWGT